MEAIKMRPLQVGDVFTVARMFGKVTKGAREQITSALSDKKRKVNPTEFGLVMFQSVFIDAEEDMKVWLADLIGKDVSEFVTMPPTTVLDIIDELSAQENIGDFFSRASQLATKLFPG